ncbi:transcriptional repressor of class iii stress genes [Lucifera butyrica]|uniref:Transcriptional repressor of class iii stress genes n=1 Tax=Lucifera butyrica TaxID=1351585 RepID=A0A498REI4_9FIRM|nr:CtsR family transcriptional regulator [Lucifera butyrica]VBB08493.1 transcriptional repressor of class iii stress genes [Lucifera butyrica]
MSNLADVIEQWILRKLSDEKDDIVILRRNEMAEEIECAPSQISYVLSTRFTVARGFIVESRRGLGGFVRIARIPVENIVYEDAARQIDAGTSIQEVRDIVARLSRHNLLTAREAALIQRFTAMIFGRVEPLERAQILRTIFFTLSEFS